MKFYNVLKRVSISGKKYLPGAIIELTDEQAKFGLGYIIEIPKAILDEQKLNARTKGKGKGKVAEDIENENEQVENENENDLTNNEEN